MLRVLFVLVFTIGLIQAPRNLKHLYNCQ